jgi:hypothetical protein
VNTNVLFRSSLAEEDECSVANRYFDVYDSRCTIPRDSLVIGIVVPGIEGTRI